MVLDGVEEKHCEKKSPRNHLHGGEEIKEWNFAHRISFHVGLIDNSTQQHPGHMAFTHALFFSSTTIFIFGPENHQATNQHNSTFQSMIASTFMKNENEIISSPLSLLLPLQLLLRRSIGSFWVPTTTHHTRLFSRFHSPLSFLPPPTIFLSRCPALHALAPMQDWLYVKLILNEALLGELVVLEGCVGGCVG